MHGDQVDAAFGDHVAGDGGVDAAGEQRYGIAVAAHRHASRAGVGRGVDVGRVVAHLQMHDELRVIHVHLRLREGVRELAADVLAELDARQGEALVGALALDLEALCRAHGLRKDGLRAVGDGVLVLRAGARAGQGDDAEDLFHGLVGAVDVRLAVSRLHIDGRLHGVDAPVAEGGEPPLHVGDQPLLEEAAVLPLEDQLALLEKDDIVVHRCQTPYIAASPPKRKVRYCTASAMCAGWMSALPSRSAIVRATRRMRS